MIFYVVAAAVFNVTLLLVYFYLFSLLNMYLFFRTLETMAIHLPKPEIVEVSEAPAEEAIVEADKEDFNEANRRRFERVEYFMQHGQEWQDKLEGIEQGCWALTEDGQVEDLHLPSVFMLEKAEGSLLRDGCRLFVAGAVSDKLLKHLRLQKRPVELVVRDFTRIFALPESYYAFLRKGGRIRVLHRSRLVAVTVNPVAPSGLVLDSERLCREMEDALHIPVYDVKRAG